VADCMLRSFAAVGVVMLVSFLCMGWRVGLVVAAAVPLALAAVFIVMAATGKDFDRITLGSLILALGLLVDDAIIAIEMMVVKMEEGYDRIRAAAYAWSHTAAPMLAGTLVTAIGFMPNGFAKSTAGEYTSNMFWIVGIALIEVQMAYGASIEQTSATTAKVETWLGKQPEAKTVTAYVGQGAPRFYLAMSPELPDPSFAKIVVLTKSEETREALKLRLRQAVADGLAPEARVRVTQLVFGPYSPFPVAFRVMGPDPDKLRDIAAQARVVMRTAPQMRTVNTDWGERVPTLHFSLDQ